MTKDDSSLLEGVHHRRVNDSAEFSNTTVILVKTPSPIQWDVILAFLTAMADLCVAASEPLHQNNILFIGYDVPNDVPQHATDLALFLVRAGIRPFLFTTDLTSQDLSHIVQFAAPHVVRYFRDDMAPPGPELLLEGDKVEHDDEGAQKFDEWWQSLSRDWETVPTEYRIPSSDITRKLGLFTESVRVEPLSAFHKRYVHLSNVLLNLPFLGEDDLNEIVAHRGLFTREMEADQQDEQNTENKE
jgi:hypothetical protein